MSEATHNWRNWSYAFAAAALLAGSWWVYQWWMQPPVVEYDNLRYIQLLRTALSSRREDYVFRVERAVRLRRDQQVMSDREAAHFAVIIALARGGDWERADQLAYDFEAAQAYRRRTARPPDAGHDHDHARRNSGG